MNRDNAEVDKFDQCEDWWDEHGSLWTLHQLNPVRLKFIEQYAVLTNKNILDVGCGGGILTEAMAKAGGHCTGIDLADNALLQASQHAEDQALTIYYQKIAVEELALQQAKHYDVITCMEMLEHVPSPESIIAACVKLLKPNGKIFFSTINRSLPAFAQVIIGAEHLLKWLPKGTHHYQKFIKPSELAAEARRNHLQLLALAGISYNFFKKEFYLSDSVSANYLVVFEKK